MPGCVNYYKTRRKVMGDKGKKDKAKSSKHKEAKHGKKVKKD